MNLEYGYPDGAQNDIFKSTGDEERGDEEGSSDDIDPPYYQPSFDQGESSWLVSKIAVGVPLLGSSSLGFFLGEN